MIFREYYQEFDEIVWGLSPTEQSFRGVIESEVNLEFEFMIER